MHLCFQFTSGSTGSFTWTEKCYRCIVFSRSAELYMTCLNSHTKEDHKVQFALFVHRMVSAQESLKWACCFRRQPLGVTGSGRLGAAYGLHRCCLEKKPESSRSQSESTRMLTWGGGRWGWLSPEVRLVWEGVGDGGQEIFRCRVMLGNSGDTFTLHQSLSILKEGQQSGSKSFFFLFFVLLLFFIKMFGVSSEHAGNWRGKQPLNNEYV